MAGVIQAPKRNVNHKCGMAAEFGYTPYTKGPVMPLYQKQAYGPGSNPGVCGFDSHQRHHLRHAQQPIINRHFMLLIRKP